MEPAVGRSLVVRGSAGSCTQGRRQRGTPAYPAPASLTALVPQGQLHLHPLGLQLPQSSLNLIQSPLDALRRTGRDPEVWIVQERSTGAALVPSLTLSPSEPGSPSPTWALQNLFISSSLARRCRVRRQVGYLSMVPEFLAKVSRAYGGSDQSGAGPGLLVDRGWGRLGWKGGEFW